MEEDVLIELLNVLSMHPPLHLSLHGVRRQWSDNAVRVLGCNIKEGVWSMVSLRYMGDLTCNVCRMWVRLTSHPSNWIYCWHMQRTPPSVRYMRCICIMLIGVTVVLHGHLGQGAGQPPRADVQARHAVSHEREPTGSQGEHGGAPIRVLQCSVTACAGIV